MNIKTVSKLDERSTINYIRAGMFFFSPLVSLIIFAVVSVGLFAMVIIGDIAEGNYKDTLVYSALIAFMVLMFLYLYFVLPKQRWKRIAASPKGETHLTFCDNSVHVITYVGGERRKEGNVAYTSFDRFKETKEYFFIYVGRTQALIVEKQKLSGGTALELRAKLKQYKSVKYKYIGI